MRTDRPRGAWVPPPRPTVFLTHSQDDELVRNCDRHELFVRILA